MTAELLDKPPRMSVAELVRRYRALPAPEDLPNERTYLTRVETVDGLLRYGASIASFLRLAQDRNESFWHCGRPDLAALILEAWPDDQATATKA